MNNFVRSVVNFRHQDNAPDLEQGPVERDIGQFSRRRILWTDIRLGETKAKVHSIFRSLLRIGRQDAPDVDAEKGVPESIPSSNAHEDPSALGISSILDLMPIPVTTPEERRLAASILAVRNSSPATPSPTSPVSLYSPGTSYSTDSPTSTLDTPLTMHAPPILRSPTHTPFLERCAKFVRTPPCETSVSLSPLFDTSTEFADFGQPQPKPRRKRWTGDAGFAFPVNRKGLFHVAEEEEEEEEEDDILATPVSQAHAISDSPWSNDEQEIYGVKGKTSWIREMKSLGSFSDNPFWIDVQIED